MANARTVIQSERFINEASLYVGTIELDRMLSALDWALSMYPDRGLKTANPLVRAVTSDLRGSIYAIYYVYDDEIVELLSFTKML